MRLFEIKDFDILNIDDFQLISHKIGSNEGGVFVNKKTNDKFYIKFSKTSNHAKNEVLASKLYKLMGSNVPDLYLVNLGSSYGVASKWVHGMKPLDLRNKNHIDSVHNDFITHVWLANWDNIGTDYDNQLIDSKNENLTVDLGGTLLYRAKGTPKGKYFSDIPTEHKVFRNPEINYQAHSVYKTLSKNKILNGINRLKNINDSFIKELVIKYGPGSSNDKENLADLLINRKNYLIKEANNI